LRVEGIETSSIYCGTTNLIKCERRTKDERLKFYLYKSVKEFTFVGKFNSLILEIL